MNLKFWLAVIGVGALAFWAGQSSPLFRETFLNKPYLVGEIPLNSTGEASSYSASLAQGGKIPPSSPEKQGFQDCAGAISSRVESPKLIINEVAWMGGPEDAAAEWFELKNISKDPLDISDYSLSDKDSQIKIAIPVGTVLSAGGFYISERKEEATPVKANLIYAGNLKNTDEGLRLYDAGCGLVDEVSASPNWPAGENETKKTMERASDLSWYTSSVAGGTPGSENSKKTIYSEQLTKPKETEALQSIVAANSGSSATSSSNTIFVSQATTSPPATNYSLPTTNSKVLISEVMVGMDNNSSYEFVELYNPNQSAIDLTGWKITKKTSSGNESTLVAASRLEGKSIPAGKYFLLANQSGYTGPVSADVFWPASYTLAYTNNSVLLYNAQGNKIEEVSWSEIPKGQSLTRTSWETNQFSLQTQPTPQSSLR